MSINDPIRLFYDEKRERFRLLRGNETFYNERREMVEFETADQAVEWAKNVFGMDVEGVELKDGESLSFDLEITETKDGSFQYKFEI